MGIQRSSKGRANTLCSEIPRWKGHECTSWVLLHECISSEASGKMPRYTHFPFWQMKRSGGRGKLLKHNLLSDLQGSRILGTMPQVLRKHDCYRTLQCVSLTTRNTPMHIKLIPALYTDFPCSNSGSQSWFPCCPMAWLGNCKWHCSRMLAGVPEALWRFLPQG